jgi:kinesin family protein 6/9
MEESSTKQASDNYSNTNTNNLSHTNTNMNSQSQEPKKESLNETIQIYLRLRPCRNGSYKHEHIDINSSQTTVEVRVPVAEQGYVNNTIRKHTFRFDKIFDCATTQEQIFNEVAKDVIDSAIDGYNGTIFAYGQTGSGKTYTITGGVESISMRGIIPRALSYIFEEIKKRTLFTWKIYISYLEIYNNDGYDLLSDTGASGTQRRFELASLPRVRIRENKSRQLILTNLSIHEIDNFQEGMALLMLGDDNRVVAETPKNDASTRSHCLFMIQIESQKIGEDLRTLSKLHIVDLSGSEKPSKTELTGIRMTEALNINISLFYLEQVIIEINNKSGYIPYRNSMMTMCLRDSLGGNCKTRMIANLSADFDDVLESLSTCRFAQRVALVKNTAIVNEVVDPAILVQKQKNEIEELKAELAMLKGKNQKSFLEQSDLEECEKIVNEFLEDDTYTKKIELNDKLMIQECFNIIKKKYKFLEKKAESRNKNEIVLDSNFDKDRLIELENENKKLQAEIERLKELLKNRDEEMQIVLKNMETGKKMPLVQRLNKEDEEKINSIKNSVLGDFVKFESLNNSLVSKIPGAGGNNMNNTTINSELNINLNDSKLSSNTKQAQQQHQVPRELLKEINLANSYVKGVSPNDIDLNLLKEQNKAYWLFRQHYYKNEIGAENKNKLKERMIEGKKLAEDYQKLTVEIQAVKKQIEKIRKIRILDESRAKDPELDKEEEKLMEKFTSMKSVEKQHKINLVKFRDEIKTMKAIDENFEENRIKHFKYWIEIMGKKLEFESKYGKINLNATYISNTSKNN